MDSMPQVTIQTKTAPPIGGAEQIYHISSISLCLLQSLLQSPAKIIVTHAPTLRIRRSRNTLNVFKGHSAQQFTALYIVELHCTRDICTTGLCTSKRYESTAGKTKLKIHMYLRKATISILLPNKKRTMAYLQSLGGATQKVCSISQVAMLITFQ